jgi:hypothetical protein
MGHGNRNVIDVRRYGAIPDSGADAGPAVRTALGIMGGSTGTTLLFPRGRYDFHAEGAVTRDWAMSNSDRVPLRRFGILLEKLGDVVIDGDGSLLVFHAPMTAIAARGVDGVTLRDLIIDFEPPFNADAEVLESSVGRILFRIDPRRHPFAVTAGSLWFTGEGWRNRWNGEAIEFERESRLIPPGTGDRSLGYGRYACVAVRRGEDRVELLGPLGNPPRTGNVVVLRHGMRDHAGIFLDRCRDARVEDVTVHGTSGLGILLQHCANVGVSRVRSVPAEGRWLAGHDDGVHASNCRGLVAVRDCAFAGLMDDPVNVHGTTVRIGAVSGRTIRARFMHGQSMGMVFAGAGDRVALVRARSMETRGEVVVSAFRAIDRATFDLTIDGSVPEGIGAGDALENLTWSPDVEIRDCDFRHCRARGLLVSTPGKVVIEGNRFESSGSAILIAGDANRWFESGAVRDVLIRGNVFTEHCLTNRYQYCEGVISIRPDIPQTVRGAFVHRNIRIESNTFRCFDYPVIYALSVSGLAVRGNTFTRSHAHAPWHGRRATMTFQSCRGVTVEGNAVDPDLLGRNIALVDTDLSELALAPGQGLAVHGPGQRGFP